MATAADFDVLYQSPLVAQAVCDANGRIVRCNAAFARFLRVSAVALSGRPVAGLFLEDGLPEATPRRRAFRAADGQTVWGECCLLGTDDGQSILQVVDCTRQQLEQRLHRGRVAVLEQLYRENSLADIGNEIVRYIEAYDPGVRCSILLLDAERGTLHRLAAPSLPDFYNEAIEGMRIGDGVGSCGTAVFRRERVVVADILDHPYWARARRLVQRTSLRACWSEPIIAHDGGVLGSFALYYETPREPLPAELDLIAAAASLTAIAISHKRAEQSLRDLDRARDEFISMAAHELRTPLTAIMGFAEVLLGGCEPPLQRDCATAIFERGEALARVIDDLLDVSLVQLGRGLSFNLQPVLLRPLLDRALESCRRAAPIHQVELQLGAVLPERLTCDPGRIAQVLDNLLGNAVKYSPGGGRVTLAAECRDGALLLKVGDQGIGMSPAEQRQAFERFYRARNGGGVAPGFGLGLGIVRHIVEGHGGTVQLDSQPGVGTEVCCRLPLAP